MNRTEILEQTKKYDREERRLLLIDLMRQQKRKHGDEPAVRDFCTLIDLSTGIIAGSGICPKCHSFIGRLDEFYETNRHTDEE